MSAPVSIPFNYPQWLAYNELRERRSLFIGWGRGVGKSFFTRTIWWLLVAQHDGKLRENALKPFRGVRITALMPTLVQFKDVYWAAIENEVGPGGEWAFLGAKLDRQRGHITFPGGSWIKPFPAAAHTSKGARGMRTDVVSVDECDDIDAAVYDSIAVPWTSEPWSMGIEILGGTPTRGRHGLWFRSLQAGRLGEQLRDNLIERDIALELPAAKSILELLESYPKNEYPAHLPLDPRDATIEVLKNYYSFHATYRDAPETVGALAVARAKATTPPATFAREWEADPDSAEGLVYPFDEDFHVIGSKHCPHREAPAIFNEFHVGMDHGWVDPGVLLLAGITGHGEDATLWFLDEHYKSELANPEWDKLAAKWKRLPAKWPATVSADKPVSGDELKRVSFWPDPSRPDRINDLKVAGIWAGEVDNEIFGGIGRVAELLFIQSREISLPNGETKLVRWSRIYVSRKCRNLIREFGLYRRKKHADGTFDETPEDKNNHTMDSARYLCVGRFGLRKKDVYGAKIKPVIL